MPVADILRQAGISEQTFYRWKKQYAGLQSDQARELKQLRDKNAQLKKLVAELGLDKAISQDVASRIMLLAHFGPHAKTCDHLNGTELILFNGTPSRHFQALSPERSGNVTNPR